MADLQPTAHAFRHIYCRFCGYTLNAPVDCGDRLCPVCSPRRAFRVRNRLRWLLDKNPPEPGYMLKMITLSTVNCKQLEDGVRHLVRSFRRLRQRHIWRDHVSGGATIIEIKGRPNNWHPHLHILCYSRWIDWHKLQPAWASISGGSACYINNISTESALRYVTKYITKVDVPPFLEYSVGTVLRKFRLFQRFGLWHALHIPKHLYDYPCPSCKKTHWIHEAAIQKVARSP